MQTDTATLRAELRRRQEYIIQLQAELYRYSQEQMELAERLYQLESEVAQLKAGQTEASIWTN